MNNSIVLGIDIGGSHITSALVNLNDRSIIWDSYHRENVNSKGTADEIIHTWSNAITKSFSQNNIDIKRMGIAMPGPFDYDKGISLIKNNDKYEALYGLNVKELIFKKLNIDPAYILMNNDAACFLKGEVFAGAAQGYKTALGITLGTGLGTAMYNNGIAEDANFWCLPFKETIAEEHLSSRWFLQRYYELSGVKLPGVELLAALYDKDKNCEKVFREFAETLAVFFIELIKMDEPEVIVLGGNISKANKLFLSSVIQHLKTSGFTIPIKISSLGEHAAILGASSLLS